MNLRRSREEALDLKESRGRLYELKQKVWSLYHLALALTFCQSGEPTVKKRYLGEGLRLVGQALALVAQYGRSSLPVRKLDSPGKAAELAHLYLLQAYFYKELGEEESSVAALGKALQAVLPAVNTRAAADKESPKYYLLKRYFFRLGDLRALHLTSSLLPAQEYKNVALEADFEKAVAAVETQEYLRAASLLADLKKRLAETSPGAKNLFFEDCDVHMLEARIALGREDFPTALRQFQLGFDAMRLMPYEQRLITDQYLDDAVDCFDRLSADASYQGADKGNQPAYLEALVSIAYLAKINHPSHALPFLERAAYLFQRARALAEKNGAGTELKASIAYDLAETLSWQDNFLEAAGFMREAWQLRQEELKLALERPQSVAQEKDLLRRLGITCDTGNMLGRMLLSGGEGRQALAVFQSNLRLVHCLKDEGRETSLDRAALKNYCAQFSQGASSSSSSFSFSGPFFAPDLEDNLALNKKLDGEMKRRLDEALQGQADVGIALRDYDLAFAVFPTLLKIREDAGKEQLIAILWQMAYVYQCSGQDDLAASYFSRLIKQYPGDRPRPLADWYYGRAMSLDLAGREKEATADFQLALELFAAHLKREEDPEQIDRFKGFMDDIKLNLLSRKRSSPRGLDYLGAEPTFYFPASAFPLKVCIDKSRAHGFAGDLRGMVEKAVRVWTDFPDSPLVVKMVENPEEADILFERALSYDDIGYGSGGRTNAASNPKQPRELLKTHVRVYCLQSGFEEDAAVPAMSRHAREQFVTLFAHEMGHAFGLAHSPSGLDIMYWKANRRALSERDRETIRVLYRGKARPK